MHTTARLSVLIGAGLLAGVMGAGPAHAAPAPPPNHNKDVVGYFLNRMDCDWVGNAGDTLHRWNDPNCDQVNYGPHRGMWELSVDRYGGSTGFPGGPHHPHGPGGPHH